MIGHTLDETLELDQIGESPAFRTISKNLVKTKNMLTKVQKPEPTFNSIKSVVDPQVDLRNTYIEEFITWMLDNFEKSEKKLLPAQSCSDAHPLPTENVHLPHIKTEKSGIIKAITPCEYVTVLFSRYLGSVKGSEVISCFDCIASRNTRDALLCQKRLFIQDICLLIFANFDFIFNFGQIGQTATSRSSPDKCHFRSRLLGLFQRTLSIPCQDAESNRKLRDELSKINQTRPNKLLNQSQSDEEMLQTPKDNFMRVLQSTGPNQWQQLAPHTLQKSLYLIGLNSLYWGLTQMVLSSAMRTDFSRAPDSHFLCKVFANGFESTHLFLIDCRFEYEFEGGHLAGAINVNDPRVLLQLFFEHPWTINPEFFSFLGEFRDRHIDIDLATHIVQKFQEMKSNVKKSDFKVCNDESGISTVSTQNCDNEGQQTLNESQDSGIGPESTELTGKKSSKVDMSPLSKNPFFTKFAKQFEIYEKSNIAKKIPNVNNESMNVNADDSGKQEISILNKTKEAQIPSTEHDSQVSSTSPKVIIIFYCEFSSERGPRMHNLMRSLDRERNPYPDLKYPGIYLLRGGYCRINQEFRSFCSRATRAHLEIKKKSKDIKISRNSDLKPTIRNKKELNKKFTPIKHQESDYFKEIRNTLFKAGPEIQPTKSVSKNAESILEKYKQKRYFIPNIAKKTNRPGQPDPVKNAGTKAPNPKLTKNQKAGSKINAQGGPKKAKKNLKHSKLKQHKKSISQRKSGLSKSMAAPVKKSSQKWVQLCE